MALMNSFDSKVNRDFRTNLVLLEIKKSHLVNTPHTEGKDIYFVTDADLDVSPFQHPLYDADEDIVYLDVRGYSILDRNGAFRLKGDLDSELLLLRAKLELAWVHGTANELFTAFSFSNDVYVRWLTETLTREFSLNPAQDTQLKVLIALFNIGQYYNSITEPALITRYYRLISQQYYVDMDTVQEIASRLTQTFPRDIAEFVAAIKEANISTRMANINEVSILNVLGGAWFMTAQPTLVVGLGLEYPPAFAAMVTMALNYRLFKKTSIGGVVDRLTKGSKKEDHIRALKYLFDRTVGEPHPGKYKRAYGMEQYPINAMAIPDFTMPAVGAESDVLSRILIGVAAGSIAGMLTYGIVKFIEWFTGNGSSGGGSGSSSVHTIQAETDEIIKKTNTSIKEAYDKQHAIGLSIGTTFDEMTAKVLKYKDTVENAGKYSDVLCKHFSGEDQIAAVAIYRLYTSSEKDNHKEVAEKLIEIDKKTGLFKNNAYVLASMLVQNRLRPSMVAAISLLSSEGDEIDDLLNDIKGQYDVVLEKLNAFIEKIKSGVSEEELKEAQAELRAGAESGELKKMQELASKFNDKIQLDELGVEILDGSNTIDALKKFNPNAKLPEKTFAKYDELVEYIGKKKSVVSSIVAAAKTVSDDENHLVNKVAREFSSVTGHDLKIVASATRPIRAAIRFSHVYANAYRAEASRLSAEISKYKASLDKIESKEG